MPDITYDYATVLYNSADIEYNGDSKDVDKWGWGQEFEVGTDVTTTSGSGSWSLIGTVVETWFLGGENQTTTYPVGTAEGDLLVFALFRRDANEPTFPAAWFTQAEGTSVTIGTINLQTQLKFRIAGSETSVDSSIGSPGSGKGVIGALLVFRNSGLVSSDVTANSFTIEGTTTETSDATSTSDFVTGAFASGIANNLGIYVYADGGHDPAGTISWADDSGLTLGRNGTATYDASVKLNIRVLYEIPVDGSFPSRTSTLTWSAGIENGSTIATIAARHVLGVATGGSETDTWQVI